MDDKLKYHKVLTCASYGCTGSSVITDLLKEFEGCCSLGDYEFRFLQDYDGVSTLESALVHNYHRMNSDIAINRFKKIINYHSGNILFPRYEKYFKGKFKEISYRYIDSLIDLSWKGYWEHHAIESGAVKRFLAYKIYPRFKRIFRKPSERKFVLQPPKRTMYLSYPQDRFIECTKKYTRELCEAVDPDYKYEYLVFDQLVPPTNIGRYLNYFDDLKVIVVDRDPRDLYISNELLWKESWIPSHDIDKYIEWYRLLRKPLMYEKDNEDRVLRLRFEEVVINYEESLKNILGFVGISPDKHIKKRVYFNPEVSIKNIGLYKPYSNREEIKKIETHLLEYCYMGEK